MADIEALRVQEYSTNLTLLSQQMTAKLAPFCMKQNAAGNKAFRMMSQIDKTEAVLRATRAQPAINIDMNHDGRWVYPQTFDWGRVIDDIDLLQTNIAPQGAYVQSAVAALNRKDDDLFMQAFFGTAQTGETGSTSTSFTSGNVIAVNYGGGGNVGLTKDKLIEARRILGVNEVDLDMEMPILGISPKQHANLLGITEVVSTDYSDMPHLVNGKVDSWMGFKIVVSNRIPVDSNSYRRCPIWVPSGMGCGIWKEITGNLRNRSDLQGNPAYAEATSTKGYTRIEEAKCLEVKCSE